MRTSLLPTHPEERRRTMEPQLKVTLIMSTKDAQMCKSPVLLARLKKPRVVSTPESDEDDVKTLFSQKLSKFKKSPSKKGECLLCSVERRVTRIYAGKRSALHSDDDEFNPASEQDEDETRSVKSFRSSSSRRSAASSSDTEGEFLVDDDEEDNPRKLKSKSAAKAGRKAKGNVAVADNSEASNAGSAFTLLTAAERREQGKKLEKKSTDEPFGFLQDVRDVR